jgi:hypothetical protein
MAGFFLGGVKLEVQYAEPFVVVVRALPPDWRIGTPH